MPTKNKIFRNVKFSPEIIKDAYNIFLSFLIDENKLAYSTQLYVSKNDEESWKYENEDEFFPEYRKEIKSADFIKQHHGNSDKRNTSIFAYSYHRFLNEVELRVELSERYMIEKIFELLESNYSNFQIQKKQLVNEIKSQVKIFIGHGRNKQWRDLKDHLHEQHEFEVIAYETGARAGFTITEILEEMSSRASFALLVLTAEDNGIDGTIRARENVIHEVGLFQGKLGFKRGIIVLEDGCNEFTNISGVQQIRFTKGSIKETYGDILATIYREFGITFTSQSSCPKC